MNNGTFQRIKQVYKKPEIRVPTEIILSVFASLVLIMTAIRPTLITVAELRKKIDDQTLIETKLKTKIKKLISAREQLDEFELNLPLFDRAVPENYAYANLAKKIEIMAIEEDVSIESLTFSSVLISEDKDDKSSEIEWVDGNSKVKNFSISFSFLAEEPSLVKMLKEVENLDRVLIMTNVSISKANEREVLGEKLRAVGKMNGYYLATTIEQ